MLDTVSDHKSQMPRKSYKCLYDSNGLTNAVSEELYKHHRSQILQNRPATTVAIFEAFQFQMFLKQLQQRQTSDS